MFAQSLARDRRAGARLSRLADPPDPGGGTYDQQPEVDAEPPWAEPVESGSVERNQHEEPTAGRLPGLAAGPGSAIRERWERLRERWLPRRKMIIGGCAVCVVAMAATVALLLNRRPDVEQPPSIPLARAEAATAPTASAPTATAPAAPSARPPGASARASGSPNGIVVSVVGEVDDPGLVRVREGARVADAVDAAGGAEPDADLTTLNRARKLSDGEQIYVGIPAPAGMDTGGSGGQASGQDPVVPLNSADREALETLSGVGEVTATAILDWRSANGPFVSVEQLLDVDGIGEKTLEDLRDKVTVE